MNETIEKILWSTWLSFRNALLDLLPGFIAATLIMLGGLLIAWTVSRIVRQTLKLAKFNQFCGNAGLTHLLNKADIRPQPAELAGRLVFWMIFLIFLFSAIRVTGIEALNRLAVEFSLYFPSIMAALLIAFLGLLAAGFLARAALLAAVNAGWPSPRLLSLAVRYLITILSFAMALEQLKIASNIVTAAFTIAFGAVMLGLAIAFGLGGREVARKVLEKHVYKKENEEQTPFQHL